MLPGSIILLKKVYHDACLPWNNLYVRLIMEDVNMVRFENREQYEMLQRRVLRRYRMYTSLVLVDNIMVAKIGREKA